MSVLEILATVILVLAAFAAGAGWARRRARARLTAEIELRERAEGDAEAAYRIKSEILANVSHEIRTPMNGVLGMTDLLLTTDLPAARRHKALEVIHTSAQGLLALIDDLLDFSKIEAGKLLFLGADFRLCDLLGKAVELLRPQAAEKGIELRLEIDPGIPDQLYGDPARLRQVLLNLLGNAVKFTREGEVSLRVGPDGAADDSSHGPASGGTPADDSSGTPGAGEECVRVRFAVRDTGIGISAKDQARIFAPFAQADSTAARQFGGTGLGLVICKNLVELMGGEIGFESAREVGSTFWFRLTLAPARQPPAAQLETPVPGDRPLLPPATDAPRVLVVDDNAVNRLVAENQLEVLGFATAAVASGSRALRRLAAERFDAVLMDCQMPALDGYETTRRLRRREREGDRRTTVIGVTAHALPGARQSALDAGMDDYLAKPYRVEELAAVLERRLPWVPREPNVDAGAEPGGSGQNVELQARDSGALRTIRRLEHDTGKDLVPEAPAAFRREGRRHLEAMRRALAAGNARGLAQDAHALGGSSDFLGASALARLCGELEDSARDGDLAGCRDRLPAVEREYDRIAVELATADPEEPSR